MTGERSTVLVLGSGDQEYREYMLASMAKRYDLVLLANDEPSWELEYVAGHLAIDPADERTAHRAAELAARRWPVAGILTYHEPCVELAAEIGDRLGLPHCPVPAAAICRDKHAARRALEHAGVPSARSRLVLDADQAEQAAAEIGYPVVVKPRALSASFGVALVPDASGIRQAYQTAAANGLPEPWAFRAGVLVEEYLDGPEISVDSVCLDERTRPVVYARKLLGMAPHFEEIGHVVGPRDELLADPDAVDRVLAEAHRAYGIDNALTHTELRLTSDGPKVIEINGRTGGGLIPYLGLLAGGVDLALAAADVAVGRVPDLRPSRRGFAGIRFFYPPVTDRIVIRGPEKTDNEPWLHRVGWLIQPGTELRPTAGRYYFARAGFGIVTADDAESCRARMETVNAGVMFETPSGAVLPGYAAG